MDARTHSVTRRLAWSSMAIAGMIIAACGDGDTTSSDTATTLQESAATTVTTLDGGNPAAGDAGRVEIDLVGCDQVVSDTGVDPTDAAPFVPDDQELYLDSNGNARAALVTKDCDEFVVDGEPLGSGHMDTLWVRVIGPREGRPIPGIPDQEGRAPDAYVPQFIHTDNAAYSQAVAAYGVPLLVADEIDADPPGTDERAGGGTNSTFDPPLSYRWTTTDPSASQGEGSAAHILHGVDTDGSPIWYDIDCPYEITGRARVTVDFEAGGPFDTLLTTGWTNSAVEMRLDCRVVIGPR